jgi:transposase-like protein
MHNGKPPIRRFVFNCLDRWDVFKVRKNSKVINKIIYLAVGLNREGKKEVFGIWLDKNKSSSFWMGVLTNLKACGAEDILILQLII